MKIILILLTIALFGCNSGYTHELQNGYKLARIYSGSSAIVAPDGKIVVGPSEYGIVLAVAEEYILGNLDAEKRNLVLI